jgi:hypothetical protein
MNWKKKFEEVMGRSIVSGFLGLFLWMLLGFGFPAYVGGPQVPWLAIVPVCFLMASTIAIFTDFAEYEWAAGVPLATLVPIILSRLGAISVKLVDVLSSWFMLTVVTYAFVLLFFLLREKMLGK